MCLYLKDKIWGKTETVSTTISPSLKRHYKLIKMKKLYTEKHLFFPKNNLISNINCEYKNINNSTQLNICQGNRWQKTCLVPL